jgi:hypothetical protein
MIAQEYFHADLYSHCFVLTKASPRGQQIIRLFGEQYIQYGMELINRRYQRVQLRIFAQKVYGGLEFRFHIHQWEPFVKFLGDNGIYPETYIVNRNSPPTPVKVDLQTLPEWHVRDYQEPIIEYLTNPEPNRIKLVEIQTGKGKTFSAMKAACRLGYRVCVILKPTFMDKWEADVKNLCGIEGDDLEVVQGTPQLKKLIDKALRGKLKAKVIIISSRTMQPWFKAYEEGGDKILADGYGCRPGDFYKTIGAGLRLIDEVHLDFHLHFKIDLYTNIEWSTSLSATLKCDDAFLNRMYEVAYPKPERFAGLPYDRYIHAFAWFYRFKNPILIRTTERGGSTYSQHAVEKSILKFRRIQDDYFAMINRVIREFFFMKYVKGDRLLIYCGSIELCAQLVSFLRNIHPSFDIRRYCEEDPYENLMEADISVSTLLSAGTGHDIAGLTTVILTNSVKATQSNIQGFGRLRNLPGKELKFVYLVCQDIPKQMNYHEVKRDLLQTLALSYSIRNNPNELG